MNNSFEVEQSFVKKLVNYNEVKFVGLRHLLGGILQPDLNHFRAVFATAQQARAQLFPTGRQDENENGIAENFLDLNRTLEINF